MVAEPGNHVPFLNFRVYQHFHTAKGHTWQEKAILRENDQISRQKLNIQSLYHLLLTKVHFYVLAINRVIEYGW